VAKIRILYVITRFDLGGAQKSLLSVLSLLPKDKYEILLACGAEGILLKDALNIPDISVNVISSLRREIGPFYDFKALSDLRRFIKNKRIDIVHTHSSKAGIIGRWSAYFAGVPAVFHTIHGWEFYRGQNFFSRNLYIFLEKITARITDGLVAVSNYDIQEGLRQGIGVPEKYHLVRYGIRRNDFLYPPVNREVKKRELGLQPAPFVVGMIACFKPQKAPEDFIRAASLVIRVIPEAKFLLIGDGVLRNRIERLIKKLNLSKNVALLGWRQDISEIIPLFDILVSTSRWEGLPAVFLEAMAAGKPIIATAVCGNSEVIKDGKNGFLVPAGDYAALSQTITLLIRDKNLRDNMGIHGFQMLNESFEVSYMVGQLEEIYKEIPTSSGSIRLD